MRLLRILVNTILLSMLERIYLQQTDEDIIEIDGQIADEIKTGIIAAPQGEDMETDDDNPDINIGDE